MKPHTRGGFVFHIAIIAAFIVLAIDSEAIKSDPMALVAQATQAAQGGIDGQNETAKDRCNNGYIFENKKNKTPENKARGHLRFSEDVYKERVAAYSASPDPSVRDTADARARTEVQNEIRTGKLCDGHTMCGSLFYQDNEGNDKIVCSNRCNRSQCGNKLADLRQKIGYNAGRNLVENILKTDEGVDRNLPQWTLDNPRGAAKMIDAYLDDSARSEGLDRTMNLNLGDSLGKSRPANQDIIEYGRTILPIEDTAPPPLQYNSGQIPGATQQYLLGVPPIENNEGTGYVPPMASGEIPGYYDMAMAQPSTFNATNPENPVILASYQAGRGEEQPQASRSEDWAGVGSVDALANQGLPVADGQWTEPISPPDPSTRDERLASFATWRAQEIIETLRAPNTAMGGVIVEDPLGEIIARTPDEPIEGKRFVEIPRENLQNLHTQIYNNVYNVYASDSTLPAQATDWRFGAFIAPSSQLGATYEQMDDQGNRVFMLPAGQYDMSRIGLAAPLVEGIPGSYGASTVYDDQGRIVGHSTPVQQNFTLLEVRPYTYPSPTAPNLVPSYPPLEYQPIPDYPSGMGEALALSQALPFADHRWPDHSSFAASQPLTYSPLFGLEVRRELPQINSSWTLRRFR